MRRCKLKLKPLVEGHSTLCPYVKDELPRDRHLRRHNTAAQGLDCVRIWCRARGISLNVLRSSNPQLSAWKWRFDNGRGFLEWMPHLAKCTYKVLFRGARVEGRVFDVQQLLKVLEVWHGS